MKSYAPSEKSGGGTLKETTLWTNPSPTSTYGGGTISLSDSKANYDYVKIYWRVSTNNALESFIIIDPSSIPVDRVIGLPVAISSRPTNSASAYGRIILSESDTSLLITTSLLRGANTADNSLAIPTKITGIKM